MTEGRRDVNDGGTERRKKDGKMMEGLIAPFPGGIYH